MKELQELLASAGCLVNNLLYSATVTRVKMQWKRDGQCLSSNILPFLELINVTFSYREREKTAAPVDVAQMVPIPLLVIGVTLALLRPSPRQQTLRKMTAV